jgi:hypothetical protein
VADWQTAARNTALRVGVDPNLFVALVRQESQGNPNARSPAGAVGYTQLMPATARGLGVDPSNPAQNLLGGAMYLKQQLKAFGGDPRKALAAYNAGPGAVQKYGGVPPFAETQAYVRAILGSLKAPAKPGRAPAIAAPTSSSTAAPTQDAASALAGIDPGQASGIGSSLLHLASTRRQAPPSGGLAPPAFAAGPALSDAYRALSSGGPAPRQRAGSLVSQLTQGGGADGPPATDAPVAPATAPLAPVAAPRGGKAPKGLPTGVAKFDGKPVAAWIAPALAYARQHGWKGTVNSGYRSDAEQKRIYDSGVRPAAKPRAYGGGGSNHEFTTYPGGAIDVSDAQALAQILARSPYSKRLQWAGAKDPVHFSHPHNGSY